MSFRRPGRVGCQDPAADGREVQERGPGGPRVALARPQFRRVDLQQAYALAVRQREGVAVVDRRDDRAHRRARARPRDDDRDDHDRGGERACRAPASTALHDRATIGTYSTVLLGRTTGTASGATRSSSAHAAEQPLPQSDPEQPIGELDVGD